MKERYTISKNSKDRWNVVRIGSRNGIQTRQRILSCFNKEIALENLKIYRENAKKRPICKGCGGPIENPVYKTINNKKKPFCCRSCIELLEERK